MNVKPQSSKSVADVCDENVPQNREKRDAQKREFPQTSAKSVVRQRDQKVSLLYRHMAIDEKSIDEKARTVEVSFSSETREVMTYDWDLGEVPEILSHGPDAVDLGPLLDAGSVLRNHDPKEPVAVPVKVWIDAEAKRGRAVIHFPEGDVDSEKAWSKVRTKLVRGISAGYSIQAYEKVKPGQRSAAGYEGPCVVATRWRVHEISLTPVPADSTVGVGRGKTEAPTIRRTTMNPIHLMCRAAGLSEEFAQKLVDRNLSNEDALKEIEAEKKRAAQANKVRKQPKAKVRAAVVEDDDDECSDDDEVPVDDAEDDDEEREITNNRLTRAAKIAERNRITEIRSTVKIAKLDDELADELIEKGASLPQMRKIVLQKIAERDTPGLSTGRGTSSSANVTVGDEAGEKYMRHLVVNVGRRAFATFNKEKDLKDAGEFDDDSTRKIERQHVTLAHLVREYLHAIGTPGARNMSPTEATMEFFNPRTKFRAAAAGNSSGDLANLLSGLQNKALARGYSIAKPTWRMWCKKGTLTDFKIAPWIQTTDFAQLKQTGESGEILDSKISDRAENRQLAIYARIISLTMQMFVNDDLDGLGRLPAMMGRSAAQLPSRLVYIHLLSNPTMADGNALFHASHGNLFTGGGSALAVAGLQQAIKGFRNQTAPQAPNDTEFNAEPIDVQPRNIIVPPDLEYTAYQLANPNLFVAETQFFKGKFDVGCEPRLSSYTNGSTTRWFLAGSPDEVDSLEVSFLDGNENPMTASWEDFDRLALRFRAWVACGVKALDWRGINRNDGV